MASAKSCFCVESKMSNVSSAGLIELKAELFRKQEEFKKEKLKFASTNCIKGKTTAKKTTIWSKKNCGVAERAKRDYVAKKEEEDSLEKSRKALELKSQLYEKIANNQNIPDEDGSQIFLVDFQKKAIDKISSEKHKISSEETEQEFDSSTDDPEEQWIEYTDSLGRTRTCLKKDLKFMQERDKEFGLLPTNKNSEEIQSQSNSESDKSEILEPQERYRQMLHEKWDAEERKAVEGPIGPIHYENVRFDEVRTHGVGYFRFSKEEVERKEQMNLLNTLRDQTKDERTKRELLKEKRDAMMAARLKKVKDRQRAKLGLPPEVEEPTTDENLKQENESEKQKEEPVKRIEPLPRNSFPMREWDIGKDKFFEREKEYFKQRRDERNYQFAPPDCYNNNVSKEMNLPKRQYKDCYVPQERKKSKMSKKQTVKMDDNCMQLNPIDTANIPLPGETRKLNFVDNSPLISSESSSLPNSTHQEQQPILNSTQPFSPVFTAPPQYNTPNQNTSSVPLEMPVNYPAVTFQNDSVSEISVQQDLLPKQPKPTIVDTRLVKNVNSLKNY
ncbi:Hypothetical predicted protein [Octopus vulgaris]|uniref:CCDC174 alpha/beta GRSR domain-containing protein n=1 Tax=Octopus vulgaris TaxID=6645 RepID=A0AA36EXU5_OCTVU|nr:Hypothetical predicted protein [Octopus vulgaris]